MDRKKDKEKGLRPLQRHFFRLLGQEGPKPIPPTLVRIYGYPLAAIISQLLFWKGMEKREDGLIYKTEKEFISELGISPAQQKLAIKKGHTLGFLEVIRKGIPAKRHWRLHYEKLIQVTITEAERKNIPLSKGHLRISEKHQHDIGDKNPTITDNTPKTTAKYHKMESASDILAAKYGK